LLKCHWFYSNADLAIAKIAHKVEGFLPPQNVLNQEEASESLM